MPKFTVAESIEINAAPERVFEVVSDFGTWTTWSPWLCAEPEASVEVSPVSNSIGSNYRWDGEVVGAGEMTHIALEPAKRIESELRFLRPWESSAEISFDFEPANQGTKLTWTMHSSLPWFLFWMKGSMVNMISMDYERGLKMLKEHIETGTILSNTKVRGIESVGPIKMLGVRKKCQMHEISGSMESAIGETEKRIRTTQVPHEGMKIAVYHHFDMSKRIFDYTAGIMVQDPDAEVDGLTSWYLPESKAFAVEHHGSYDNLGNAWGAAYSHVRYKKLKQNAKAGTFEIYRNEPPSTTAAELITDIFLPLK